MVKLHRNFARKNDGSFEMEKNIERRLEKKTPYSKSVVLYPLELLVVLTLERRRLALGVRVGKKGMEGKKGDKKNKGKKQSLGRV